MGADAHGPAVIPSGDGDGQIALVDPAGGIALSLRQLLGQGHHIGGEAAGGIHGEKPLGRVHQLLAILLHVHGEFLLLRRGGEKKPAARCFAPLYHIPPPLKSAARRILPQRDTKRSKYPWGTSARTVYAGIFDHRTGRRGRRPLHTVARTTA